MSPLISRGFLDFVAPRILSPYGLALEKRRRGRSIAGIIGAAILVRVGLSMVSRARRASEQKGRYTAPGATDIGPKDEAVTSGLS